MKPLTKIIVLALVAGCVTFSAFSIFDEKEEQISKNISLFNSVFTTILTNYVDELEAEKLMRNAIDAAVHSIDPYSQFFDAEQTKQREKTWAGIQYAGIGAAVKFNKNNLVEISDLYEGYGAQLNDLRAGDEVVKVDSISTKNLSFENVLALMRGTPETNVNITVKRSFVGEINKTITRKLIITKTVTHAQMLNDSTGYILIEQFLYNTTNELTAAFNQLKTNKKLNYLIIDLRNNIGGLVQTTVDCLNLFIDKNTNVLNLKARNKTIDSYTTKYDALDSKIPIAILVNQNTISSGEIFVGAMQDLDRAIIIGNKTFGKGFVQGTRFTEQGTSLYITAARYHTPSGRCIQQLDYSKNYSDKQITLLPQNQKEEFKTKNGRTVYNIGGVEPDVKTNQTKISIFCKNLIQSNLFYSFLNEYRNTHEQSIFEATSNENIYANFTTYVNKSNFDFTIDEEKNIALLEENFAKTKKQDYFKNEIKSLKQKAIQLKKAELKNNKQEIMLLLKSHLAYRYKGLKGKMEIELQSDSEIITALSSLKPI